MSKTRYKRVLLKLSGEALCANTDGILNFDFISEIAEVIKKTLSEGVEIAVIVGAGNIWRGRQGGKMNRVTADSMGMLATAINSLALKDTFIPVLAEFCPVGKIAIYDALIPTKVFGAFCK